MKAAPFLLALLSLTLSGCLSPRAAAPPSPPAPEIQQPAPEERELPATAVASVIASPVLADPVIADPAVAKSCPAFPPVCKGGLISQDASPEKINAYIAKWGLTIPLSCRFQEPPKCYSGEKSACKACTP